MRKYLFLLSSLVYLSITLWQIYYAYSPKTGPIGNGLNENNFWLSTSISLIGGLCFVSLAIYRLLRSNKK